MSHFLTLRRSLRWPGRGRVLSRRERDRFHRAPSGGRPGPSQRQAARAAPGLRDRPRRHRSGGAQGAQRLRQCQVRAREERRRRGEGLPWLTGDDTRKTNKKKTRGGALLACPCSPLHAEKSFVWERGKKERKKEKETSLTVIYVICISKTFTSSVCECSKHTPHLDPPHPPTPRPLPPRAKFWFCCSVSVAVNVAGSQVFSIISVETSSHLRHGSLYLCTQNCTFPSHQVGEELRREH